MSYQVLARKWRPRNFSALVGQEHVVQALSHALEQQRLHHAWLFTGTRGVGKTTLARILAKCLNCAQGITAEPCGQCQACVEIDAGRFVDYIELDAASNRRVEEMTQLLEQAVYAPSSGRFKVYTIDEVHMLTGHAFNAMLKTLEEPPAHVKFILATTDPQKIPATVLSRCLQFNLKQISVPVIAAHLADVLNQEQIAFEEPALNALAQAAAGSMRDALSLTDQAIAYSAQDIRLETVQSMLGSIDGSHLSALMEALCARDAQALLTQADRLHQQGLSFAQTLSDWAELLSQVATAQRAPGFVDPNLPHYDEIDRWARQLPADLLQLYYTVAIHSRHELHLAPTEYTGFIMACLRMLALTDDQPAAPAAAPAPTPAAAPEPSQTAASEAAEVPEPSSLTEPEVSEPTEPTEPSGLSEQMAIPKEPSFSKENASAAAPTHSAPASFGPVLMTGGKDQPTKTQQLTPVVGQPEQERPAVPLAEQKTVAAPGMSAEQTQADEFAPKGGASATEGVDEFATRGDASTAGVDASATRGDEFVEADAGAVMGADEDADWAGQDMPAAHEDGGNLMLPATLVGADAVSPPSMPAFRLSEMNPARWTELSAQLPLAGWAAQLARHSEWVGQESNEIRLRLELRSVEDMQAKTKLNTVLNEYFGQVVRLKIEYGHTGAETARAKEEAHLQALQQQAEASVAQDPFINALKEHFGARVIRGSILAHAR